jgi:hypothetical protein
MVVPDPPTVLRTVKENSVDTLYIQKPKPEKKKAAEFSTEASFVQQPTFRPGNTS